MIKFENVISVGIGTSEKTFDYQYRFDEYVECDAWGKNRIVNSLKGEMKYLTGTSFATPNITGICALLIEKYGKKDLLEMRKLLADFSTDDLLRNNR